jgi:hypothetical protein
VTARWAKLVAVVTALLLVAAACSSGEEPRSIGAPSRGGSAITTAPTSTTAPPTTTPPTDPPGPVANPWPLVGPAPAEHHVILTMGDSLMGQTASVLPGVLAAYGFDATVYDAHLNATGLLDLVNGVSASDIFTTQMALHPDVDTVIFEWLNVCVACSERGIAYGSPEFYETWSAAQRALVLDAYSRGLQVVWAVSPPPPPDTTGEVPREDWFSFSQRPIVAATLAGYDRRLHRELGVTNADWWEALSDTAGQFQMALWWDDALHAVRLDDRVHLTDEGAQRTATWTVAALAELYAAAPGSH